jgi:Ca2+-transporting ATPase
VTARRPLPLARVAGLFDPDRGLGASEVEERRRRHGHNDIAETPSRAWLDLLRDTASDPMIGFLAATGTLYAVLGQVAEAVTLVLAIVPLAGMDAFLHRRTRASLEGLRRHLASRATVIRAGDSLEVPLRDVVPGDLAVIREGEWFPADGVLLAGDGLQSDESSLTGESFPAPKRRLSAPPPDGDEPAVDGEHWVCAGTRLLTGTARMRVVYTGAETIYGGIVQSAVAGRRAPTPLQAAMARLLRWLLGGAVAFCILVAGVRLAQGHGWVDAVVSAVSLATAALPEEYPVVFTFFLGVGVYRLARRKALVRRAVSVENIGRVTCICSDKTGTITEGRLRLARVVPAAGLDERGVIEVAALASRPGSGDPLDAAILAARAGGGAQRPERLATYPFTEDRRRETGLFRRADGTLVAATKGAYEAIFDAAAVDAAGRESWGRAAIELSESGFKVIACAAREGPADDGSTGAAPTASTRGDGAPAEPSGGFLIAGLLAFEDPVRPGVAEAIDLCRRAGIRPIMVTGDHPETARAVARAVGLGDGEPRVVSGEDLEAGPAGGAALDPPPDVIARATPAQKLLLVRGLQKRGEHVAVTGDGVNDVPALMAADVGIAMGERGTRSAREAAAIVLMDDNFGTIVRAVAEGRQLFANLRLAFDYLLTIHIPLVLSAALIPLAGYPLLYLPIHIVWLELLIHPTALLVFQEMPPGEPRPRRRAERFFSGLETARIVAVGLAVTTLVIAGFVRGLTEGGAEHGRAVALAALTTSGTAVMLALSRLRTRPARIMAAIGTLLSVALIQIPWAAERLHLLPLDLADWAIAVAGSAMAVGLPFIAVAVAGRAQARPGRAPTRPVGAPGRAGEPPRAAGSTGAAS